MLDRLTSAFVTSVVLPILFLQLGRPSSLIFTHHKPSSIQLFPTARSELLPPLRSHTWLPALLQHRFLSPSLSTSPQPGLVHRVALKCCRMNEGLNRTGGTSCCKPTAPRPVWHWDGHLATTPRNPGWQESPTGGPNLVQSSF